MVKPSLKKQPKTKQDITINPDLIGELYSRRVIVVTAARVQGIQWLKWLHLKGLTICQRERIKTN